MRWDADSNEQLGGRWSGQVCQSVGVACIVKKGLPWVTGLFEERPADFDRVLKTIPLLD